MSMCAAVSAPAHAVYQDACTVMILVALCRKEDAMQVCRVWAPGKIILQGW